MSRLNTLINKDLNSQDCYRDRCIPGNFDLAHEAIDGIINWCQVHDSCSKCGMNQNNLEGLLK